ncbi:IPT/TIG domain-containing protein [Streptomyces sp. NBC_00268]|uniref:IPT/TIG domain-containing protein n=1 Tax=Streptomyces sp. NBC_00268 TaxID=2975695 RepID=UPI00225BB188|nr:IPT/TIG domain-containing protein [Streptomyces sp. NBC_00268]MCX5182649.1 IPT/TIG domain-containing protein [Streptomyces sp. NBC_00268]
MGLYKADGTRITKAAFPANSVADPEKVISQDIYSTRPYTTDGDQQPEGSIKTLAYKAGAVLRQSDIDKLFPAATIATVSPTTGPVAGGTVVTITGTNLDGVSAVNFGATAGTVLTILSAKKLTVTAPAGAAGAKDVVLVDDAGNVTKTGGFTYA